MKTKKIISLLLIISAVFMLTACGEEESSKVDSSKVSVDMFEEAKEGDTVVEIHVKEFGVIKVRFFEEAAPKAVENFIELCKKGYYDNVTFHRVINDFMIQGGDPTGTGSGGESIWGEDFKDEFNPNLVPVRGTLCMANSGSNTNGSQFFIVQSKSHTQQYEISLTNAGISKTIIDYYVANGGTPWLYKAHTVFGFVYEGMDVVDKIAAVNVSTDAKKPLTDVIIEKTVVTEYK